MHFSVGILIQRQPPETSKRHDFTGLQMSFFHYFFLVYFFAFFFQLTETFPTVFSTATRWIQRCSPAISNRPCFTWLQMSFYGAFLWSYFYWYGLFELYFRLSVTEDSAKMAWRCSLWRRRDTKLCSLESVSLYASSHIVLLSVIWTDKHVHWKDGESLFFSKSLGAPWLVNGCGWSTWQFLPLYQ